MYMGSTKIKSSGPIDLSASVSPVVFSPMSVTNADGLRDRFPSATDLPMQLPEGVSVGLDLNPFSSIPQWMWWAAGGVAALGFLMRKRR